MKSETDRTLIVLEAIESSDRMAWIRLAILIFVITVYAVCEYGFQRDVCDRVLWRFPTKAETERIPK